MVDPEITSAVRQGGVGAAELDARGLMPVATARAILRGTTVVARGEGQDIAGTHVLASDIVWAALLSLEDGAEFCAAATALVWETPPRGMFNVDLWKRYGDAIVPWLASRAQGDVLVDHPWCVVPCLLACTSSAAFELVWRIRRVDGREIALATEWLDRHPDAGAAYLAMHVRQGDPRAAAQLAAMRARGMHARVAAAVASIGDPEGRLAWITGGPPTVAGVLALLDACAARLVAPALNLWPLSTGEGPRRCHGMRAIAAREGESWGLAIERLEGDRAGGVAPARIAIHAFGARVGGRFAGAQLAQRALDTSGAPRTPAEFTPWLAARLAADPDAVWGSPTAALPALGLSSAATIVAVVTPLAHVDGPPRARGPDVPHDPDLHRLPSESPVYQALAAALV